MHVDLIHGTLAHMLAAEIVWLTRWQGAAPPRLLAASDFSDPAAIRALWQMLVHERLPGACRMMSSREGGWRKLTQAGPGGG